MAALSLPPREPIAAGPSDLARSTSLRPRVRHPDWRRFRRRHEHPEHQRVRRCTLDGAALNATNVDVGSRGTWTIDANSTVSQQVTNAGFVAFTPQLNATALASHKTLTTKDYFSASGLIGLNTFLGGDNSPSDRLIINGGTASGTSGLRITNTGGQGDLTLGNGIPVVAATNGGTTAPGAFGLSGPVVAGPYEYFLFRGGVTPGNENDLFLRNVAGPIPPEPPGPTRRVQPRPARYRRADPAARPRRARRHPARRPCRSRSSARRRSSMPECRRWRA